MPFWINMYLSWPYTIVSRFRVCQMCWQAHPVYSISSRTKLYLNGHETILVIHLKRTKGLSCTCNHQNLLYSIFNYLIVVYFTFIYLRHIWLILTQFWSYIKSLGLYTSTNCSVFIKLEWCWWLSFTDHAYLQLYLWSRLEA